MMNRIQFAFVLFSIFILATCSPISNPLSSNADDTEYYKEKHRPQFHFSPEANWMNDPNGMVFYEGEYHLFYQYYPDSTVWGPMHWGHAITTDLVHFEHLPIALYPDEHGLIFSGSAVVDWNNTSGFGENNKPPLVAIYSYHSMEKEKAGKDDFQTQGVAYSNDNGRTWMKYANNPVIKNPGVRDFRDPKVIWHEESKQWIMAVAALDHLMIYGSGNLKNWNFLSEFGKDVGSHDGVWECPDLFPLQADNGKEYWVLIQNMGIGNPNGGSGTQYFIGQFDGKDYSVDEQFRKLLKKKQAIVPPGEIFEDFESGYENWSITGTAFGNKPARGAMPNQNAVNGYKGKQLVNSFLAGDQSNGTMTSEPFTIGRKAINFLIGGGNHRGKTYISLLVDGKIVRQAEGKNNESLIWCGWDVSGYINKKAQLKIVDNYAGAWGHIAIDEITFADEIASASKSGAVWLDAGCDNYAGVTWSDVPERDGRRIFIGWMSNWAYAQVVPTEKWRSAMTIPWSLSINHIDGIPRLVGQPVKELSKLADQDWKTIDNETENIQIPKSGLFELKIETEIDESKSFGFEINNQNNEKIAFEYNPNENAFYLLRNQTSKQIFSPDFEGIHTAERLSKQKTLKIHAFVDHSSIEIFLDDGQNIFTDLFFPLEPYTTIRFIGPVDNAAINIRSLKSIWR